MEIALARRPNTLVFSEVRLAPHTETEFREE
jgi:hypothetical protein